MPEPEVLPPAPLPKDNHQVASGKSSRHGETKPNVGFRFGKGNQAALGFKHDGRKLCTQQLKSILGEEFREYDAKTKTFGRGQGISNLRKLLENLVFNATVNGDLEAIKEIFNRIDGRPVQSIGLDGDGASRVVLIFNPVDERV